MTVQVSPEQIAQLAPRMQPRYGAAFASGQAVLDSWGISANPRRVVQFLAQVLHESLALTLEYENLDYSAARLAAVWPQRFRRQGRPGPAAYAHNPRKLANLVYGKRMGNVEPDDGYLYRGRGLLQLTGKDSYARATRALATRVASGPDFVAQPDAVLDPAWCLHAAAAIWEGKGCNELADQGDLTELTRRINGADKGLADRDGWCRTAAAIWCPELASAPLGRALPA